MSLEETFVQELHRIRDFKHDEDEFIKSLETASQTTDEAGNQVSRVIVTNNGNFLSGWHRVEVHQPFLNEILSMGDLDKLVGYITTGAGLGSSVPGIGTIGGAVIAALLSAMIFFKKIYVEDKDNGEGIYFTINRAELSFLTLNYVNPAGLAGFALAKPVHSL